MAKVATKSNQGGLPPSLIAELERRRAGLARHMARAIVSVVRWDEASGPVQRAAIARACEAGLDLFLATAREARPATQRELREVAQLGILQARGAQSVEPVLQAYRIAAKVAWDAIVRAWRGHPEATPEALVITANYVFSALDQVAAEVTRTYLHAREQHMQRGTRARARLFHALISDTFDSELSLQKQALALNLPMAQGYVAIVCTAEGPASSRGGEVMSGLVSRVDIPDRALWHATDPNTLVVLYPALSEKEAAGAGHLVEAMQEAGVVEASNARIRAGVGGFHSGLHGTSRSYLEAQQALEVGRKLRPWESVHEYDAVAPYMAMVQNPVVAERFVRHILGPLLDPDLRGADALLATLESVVTRGSVKAASEAMGLHRHTVIYRIEKVNELLGRAVDDPAHRDRIRLALELRRLL